MTTLTLAEDTPAGTYTLVPVIRPTSGPDGDVGIDLSRFNDVKDFLSVKNSGKKVVIHRATLGSTGLDNQFLVRWPEMKQVGFDYYGLYHLFIPGIRGALQYNNLMEVTKGDFGNYPLTVDVEPIPDGAVYNDPINEVINPLREFLGLIKSTYKPIVYTRATAATIMGLTNQMWLLDYPLHIANYNQGGVALVADPWKSAGKPFLVWQHWNKGIVPGILGNVDLDTYTGQAFAAG